MPYKKAITILMGLETLEEFRNIVIELAKLHPSILVELTNKEEEKVKVDGDNGKYLTDIKYTALFLYNNPNLKVDGIRMVMNTFSLGLKEAKDVYYYATDERCSLGFHDNRKAVVTIGLDLRNYYLAHIR